MKLPRRAVITYAATAAAAAAGVVAGGGVASAQSAYVANVMAHGAVGDGVTDDTDAFQAAIDAIAGAGGGRLVIPPNTYVLAPGDPYHGIMLRADNMTVTATGATFVRPTESYGAVFGASTRDGEPVGYGSGLRNLDWTGGRFLGSISDGNFVPGFSLHHPQHCTFRGITFENCLARASHMFDIVGAEDITIEDCRFLGQESPTDDKAYAEAIQIGESYRGGLSRPVPDVGFSGLMCRDITVRNCEFLPHDGQAGPTPFGFHSGV